jgi:C4-dicarboxylate transporter
MMRRKKNWVSIYNQTAAASGNGNNNYKFVCLEKILFPLEKQKKINAVAAAAIIASALNYTLHITRSTSIF